MFRKSLSAFGDEVKGMALDYARNFYSGLRESGLDSHTALAVMRLYSIALNDYVPSNYKPNKKEVPSI